MGTSFPLCPRENRARQQAIRREHRGRRQDVAQEAIWGNSPDRSPGRHWDFSLWGGGANALHGLRRTNEDKRRAVTVLLTDEEWAKWSDREIARRAAVSNAFVTLLRRSLLTVNSEEEPTAERTYTTKHGTVATMRTDNIGAKPLADDEVVLRPPQAPEVPTPRPASGKARQRRALRRRGGYGSVFDFALDKAAQEG